MISRFCGVETKYHSSITEKNSCLLRLAVFRRDGSSANPTVQVRFCRKRFNRTDVAYLEGTCAKGGGTNGSVSSDIVRRRSGGSTEPTGRRCSALPSCSPLRSSRLCLGPSRLTLRTQLPSLS